MRKKENVIMMIWEAACLNACMFEEVLKMDPLKKWLQPSPAEHRGGKNPVPLSYPRAQMGIPIDVFM